MIENIESFSVATLAGGVLGAIISTLIKTHNLKKVLKEEIVDPDIDSVRKEIKNLDEKIALYNSNFKDEISRMTEENNKLSNKIDKNFFELNRKMDDNNKEVANIQGMVSVMFNAMKQQSFYEQQ